MSEITPEMQSRFEQILGRSLGEGSHSSLEDGMCAMEAVSYVAGEPWSDAPQCACPVIAAFVRAWNDGLPSDADRDRLLKPLIPRIVGTRSTPHVEERRAYLALDWLVRVYTPAWLDLVESLRPHAQALRDLPEITDIAGATAAGERVRSAREASAAARAAARAAAWAAAWAAALKATMAAAWEAAWDAAWDAAARAAALEATMAAAWDAVWAAARDKTHEVLAPTVELLQASAVQLVERMIAEGRSDE
jgi:hypothetical protein